MDTPGKKGFQDDSLLNTPMPQASSTVERKQVGGRRAVPLRQEIPVRDVPHDQSRWSARSSLGILSMDNTDDFRESLNEKLTKERLLAQSVLERSRKSLDKFREFPSHLLKSSNFSGKNFTTGSAKNESTINLSHFENRRSDAGKISFRGNEISARSSSLSTSRPDISSIVQERYEQATKECNLQFDDIMKDFRLSLQPSNCDSFGTADVSGASESSASWTAGIQDSMINKLQNELFTPAELAGDKLLADEISWRNERDIPVTSAPQGKTNMDTSCFSGYIGDGDISLKSSADEKVSIGEFFRRKTEDVNALGLKTSPEKDCKPVPLLEMTVESSKFDDDSLMVSSVNPPRESISNTLSLSRIGDIIANANDTPSKIMDYLLRIKQKRTAQEDSTLKASQLNTKENSSTETIKNKSRNNKPVLKDSSNTSENPENAKDDWTDAASDSALTPNTNRTIGPYIESPSYACTELEFSEEDNQASEAADRSDQWIHLENYHHGPAGIGISYDISINMLSLTNSWILVRVKHLETSVNGIVQPACNNAVKLTLPNYEGLIASGAQETCHLSFVTMVPGCVELNMQYELTNMVTKKQQFVNKKLIVDSKEIKIDVKEETLDFGMVPERSHKDLSFTIQNMSEFDVPINLRISEDNDIFKFKVTDSSGEERTVTKTRQMLHANGSLQILLNMHCSKLNGSTTIQAFKSNIVISHNAELKPLKHIPVEGTVGKSHIRLMESNNPLRVRPGETKSMQVKNAGELVMDFTGKIATPDGTLTDPNFSLAKNQIRILPGQSGWFEVTFKPNEWVTTTVKRLLVLRHPGGPTYYCPVEGLPNSNSPCSSDRLSPNAVDKEGIKACWSQPERPPTRGSTTSTSSLSNLKDGKLPIDSTRTELVWGCIKPGKSSTKEFIIKNRVAQRIRFQIIMTDPAFKLVKDQSENVSNMVMMLHGMESRTIGVNFSPNTNGAVAGKLMFAPIENDSGEHKKQMILLYGYGGHSTVNMQSVGKDLSGKMWLSLGRLGYEDILTEKFRLENSGTLPSFASLSLRPSILHTFRESSVLISPSQVVIPPNKSVEISIGFSPRSEDMKAIHELRQSDICEIANLQIITGPEPTRGRIRRLYSKLCQQNLKISNNSLMSKLSIIFPCESMPSDLILCRESVKCVSDLLHSCVTREIILTVENDPNCTAIHLASDETCLFQPLCDKSISMTILETTSQAEVTSSSEDTCTVEPATLLLMPPSKTRDSIVITSKNSRPMPFTARWKNKMVNISPSVGSVPPGQSCILTVECVDCASFTQTCSVMIQFESQVTEVTLKILPMIPSHHT